VTATARGHQLKGFDNPFPFLNGTVAATVAERVYATV
jgi:hypothetical protein